MPPDTLRSAFDKVRIDGEGKFICKCGGRMKEFLVTKNPSVYYGSKFYGCAKYSTDSTRCKTQIWFDEKGRVQSLISPAMKSPRTPRKQVDIRIFGQYTAPSSLKRKAETESFDSGLGDITDNDPVSPSASRSVKRAMYGYVDAATQTEDIGTTTPAPAVRPVARAIPRRRLFDEYLPTSRRNPPTKFDPFLSRTPDSSRTIFGSMPPGAGYSRPSPLQPKESTASSNNRINSFTFPTSRHPRQSLPQAGRPTTPPSLRRNTTGLFTPPTTESSRPPHPTAEPDEPKTPTKSNHTSKPLSTDSDDETYGWDDDLDQNVLEVIEGVENPRSSPLFV
ncbi:hypothetical protein BJX76DRAFT_325753 [Aspergillus varians]